MRPEVADLLGYQCSAVGASVALAEVRLLRRACELAGSLPPVGPVELSERVRGEQVAALRVVEELLGVHLAAQLRLDDLLDDALLDYGRGPRSEGNGG